MNDDANTAPTGAEGCGADIVFTGREAAGGVRPLSAGDRTTGNLDAFTVYAHYTGADNFADAAATSTPNFMFAQEVNKVSGAWTYAPTKYWPANGEKVSFFAITPAPEATNGIALVGTGGAYTGYPAFAVTPPADPAAQQDICVAAALDRTQGSAVPFSFAHAMAKVSFSARLAGQDAAATLTQLEFGNLYTGGTLTLTGDAFTWTPPANKGTYTIPAAQFTPGTSSYAGESVSTPAGEGVLMLVPQTLAGATATATLSDNSAATFSMPALTLDAGKQYTCNLTNIDTCFLRSESWAATATTSGTEPQHVLSNMFDGDRNTYWRSSTTGGWSAQSFTVDMGGYKRIDGFYYFNPLGAASTYSPKSITVETSLNNVSWTTDTYTNLSGKTARITLPLNTPLVARYVRVRVTECQDAAGNYARFAEFGAWNKAGGCEDAALSLPEITLLLPTENFIAATTLTRTFSWEPVIDDPVPANYTLQISKNPDMSSATTSSVAGTSKALTPAELEAILGTPSRETLYWTVSAPGSATSPAPRPLILARQTMVTGVLMNATPPFSTNQVPGLSWEPNRVGQLAGWTHSPANIVSFDGTRSTGVGSITMFAYPVTGANVGHVTNGKVYQTVNLGPGVYTLKFVLNGWDGNSGVDAYGVVTTQTTLPDYNNVLTDANVLGQVKLSALPPPPAQFITFTLSASTDVTLGWVYNTFNTPHGWVSFRMSSIDLWKDE
jgi:hypothetical protein